MRPSRRSSIQHLVLGAFLALAPHALAKPDGYTLFGGTISAKP